MFKSCLGLVTATALAAGSLIGATGASASVASNYGLREPAQIIVRYDDLDLATRSGRASLYHRLRQAATKVCPDADARDLGAYMRAQACQIAAVQRAVRAIGGPMITQLQAEHGLTQERTVSQD
jgi:UrcA family protein